MTDSLVTLARGHIVDQLIEERAPTLAASSLWPLVRPLLYKILDYRKARGMADTIAAMGGAEALDFISSLLEVRVQAAGMAQLPTTGRLVIVANHPTGIADGVAIYDAIKPLRPDLCFFANSDAHRVCPGFDEVLIPVEWVEAKRTRERARLTLKRAQAAFEAERAVMIFPAGKLAVRGADGKLSDPEWMASALSLARKYAAPVVPIHMTGPYSHLFHAFHRVSRELRDVTLFHELLNKRHGLFTLQVGAPISPEALGSDSAVATEAMKAYVERVLPVDPDQPFRLA
jgi:putative hemolysin